MEVDGHFPLFSWYLKMAVDKPLYNGAFLQIILLYPIGSAPT